MALNEWTWYDFTSSNVAQCPEVGGVYMLGDPARPEATVFYVGQSATLRSRLTQHLYETENTCVQRHLRLGTRRFCYKVVPGGEQARREKEASLIRQYRPECNEQSGSP